MCCGSETSRFDVVALVGSAGAFVAGMQVLGDLPPGFDVPLVVVFHPSPDSQLEQIHACLPFCSEWAHQGAILEPGKVLICPPRHSLELTSDGVCLLAPAKTVPWTSRSTASCDPWRSASPTARS